MTSFADPNRTVDFIFNKSGGVAFLGSNLSVGGTITVNTGNTLNKMGYTLTGTLVNNGTIIP